MTSEELDRVLLTTDHALNGSWVCDHCGRLAGNAAAQVQTDGRGRYWHGNDHAVRRVQPWEPLPEEVR